MQIEEFRELRTVSPCLKDAPSPLPPTLIITVIAELSSPPPPAN